MLPTLEKEHIVQRRGIHPAWYVVSWIAFSSIAILFNKYLLSTLDFRFPAVLTCWHLLFSSLMTQILARTTTLLDSRKKVKMSKRLYLRTIVPIGVLYSMSLVCSNQTYLYLSVAFIQMLKASAPVAVLLTSWLFRVVDPKLTVFLNIMVIVFGVTLASCGEIDFSWIGFLFQAGGIFAEAVRLVMIQILLSGEGKNMDPLLSLYYYSPVCAVMNFFVAWITESATFSIGNLFDVGLPLLLLNAMIAFMLNVSSVFLIGKTSGLVMTLCGVLKNILIVFSSILIWGTIITPLQIIGYSIALVGLIYYGIGYQGIKAFLQRSSSIAQDLRQNSHKAPWMWIVKRAAILLVGLALTLCFLAALNNTGMLWIFILEGMRRGVTVASRCVAWYDCAP